MREATRERDVFRTLYADMDRVGTIACVPGERLRPPTRERVTVSGPIKTRGTAATARQLGCFKAAIARSGVAVDEAFVPALAPGWLDHFIYNEHYSTDEEFVYALADAMSDKYRAIVESGFILQIDDPGIATSWDMLKPEPSLADYRKYMPSRAFRRRKCATIGAGAAGTTRTSTTYRSNTSSTSPSRSGRKPTRSRRRTCGISTRWMSGERRSLHPALS
jgi:hypothetical protein